MVLRAVFGLVFGVVADAGVRDFFADCYCAGVAFGGTGAPAAACSARNDS